MTIDIAAMPVGQKPSGFLTGQGDLFFMHFWANDDAGRLAEGLKAALAQINIAKS